MGVGRALDPSNQAWASALRSTKAEAKAELPVDTVAVQKSLKNLEKYGVVPEFPTDKWFVAKEGDSSLAGLPAPQSPERKPEDANSDNWSSEVPEKASQLSVQVSFKRKKSIVGQ